MIKVEPIEAKVMLPGEPIDFPTLKHIAEVKFAAYSPGEYTVNVSEDGSWLMKKEYVNRVLNECWTVTYLDDNNEPQIMVFDNSLAANACYKRYYEIYKSNVWIDNCEVYGSFMVAGE